MLKLRQPRPISDFEDRSGTLNRRPILGRCAAEPFFEEAVKMELLLQPQGKADVGHRAMPLPGKVPTSAAHS